MEAIADQDLKTAITAVSKRNRTKMGSFDLLEQGGLSFEDLKTSCARAGSRSESAQTSQVDLQRCSEQHS